MLIEYLQINHLLFLHFLISLLLGYIAKKYLDRPFALWFAIGFLVPVLSILILILVGYDGVYCPQCSKKIRKNCKICPHCGFNIEEHDRIMALNKQKYLDQEKGHNL